MVSSTGDPVWRSGSPASRIAIITALRLEADLVRRAAVPSGSQLLVSGPGLERAAQTARQAIATGARALISLGLAGGLAREAQTGAVCLPLKLIGPGGEWPADGQWQARVAAAIDSIAPMIDGPVYSSRSVLTDPDEKRRLAEQTGAVAVDMESAAIAEAAADAGVQFIALRIVADGPEDALPIGVGSLVNSDGSTRYAGLVPYLGSWRQMRLLIALARKSGRARNRLAAVLGMLAESTR